MARRITIYILIFAISLSLVVPMEAHEREDHDADIEYVLFGEQTYKQTHPRAKTTIQALEDAVYLCIDQYNGNGKKELENLVNSEMIPGIPQSIDEFNYTSNYSHRSLTHRGWNQTYEEKAHWEIRQTILRNTVEKELFASVDLPLAWFPWLSNLLFADSYEKQKEQCEGFCILLYCVHVLGDHIEAGAKKDLGQGRFEEKTLKEKLNGIAYIYPLAHTADRDNPGIIPDLIMACENIFQSKSNSGQYTNLIQELTIIQDKSEKLYNSVGGINTEEKFNEYNAYASEVLEILAAYVPELLKKEEFFSKTFY